MSYPIKLIYVISRLSAAQYVLEPLQHEVRNSNLGRIVCDLEFRY